MFSLGSNAVFRANLDNTYTTIATSYALNYLVQLPVASHVLDALLARPDDPVRRFDPCRPGVFADIKVSIVVNIHTEFGNEVVCFRRG